MAIDVNSLISAPMLQDAFVAKDGTPLSAGVITCYVDTARTVYKNWYYQVGSPGAYNYISLPNPMTLSAAGTIEDVNGNDVIPFFYPYNETDGSLQPYYITVQDSNGQFQFTRENFPFFENPPENTTAIQTLEQYIINNCFWRNLGPSAINATFTSTTPSVSVNGLPIYYITIAPSQHDGFHLPDITFVKNTFGSADTITFKTFPLGDAALFPKNITPEFYINHVATDSVGAETLKAYQFPISLHVQTLDSVNVTFTVSAQDNGSPVNSNFINIALYKYLGTGATSPDPIVVKKFVLTGAWDTYDVSYTFPTTEDDIFATIPVGDDAYYLQIQMPTSQICNINFTLPSIYLGTDIPNNSFKTYDQIDAIINSPRTGDIRLSMNAFNPFGWVAMNGGTIGNNLSGAGGAVKATARNAQDTWQLFNLLWQAFKLFNVGTANLLAQMYDFQGNAVTYGATAYADFSGNKCMQLTNSMGQVLLGTVPLANLIAPYQSVFTATQVLTNTVTCSNSGGLLLATSTTAQTYILGQQIKFTDAAGLPGGITQNVTYYALSGPSLGTFYIATSLANAQSENVLAYVSSGTANRVVVSVSLLLSSTNALNVYFGSPVTFSTTGSLPTGLSTNVVYYLAPINNQLVCVATSYYNAISGNYIAYASAGTATNTLSLFYQGSIEGESNHTQLAAELAYHVHSPLSPALGFFVDDIVSAPKTGPNEGVSSKINATTAPTGSSVPFNIRQPGIFVNMYMKL